MALPTIVLLIWSLVCFLCFGCYTVGTLCVWTSMRVALQAVSHCVRWKSIFFIAFVCFQTLAWYFSCCFLREKKSLIRKWKLKVKAWFQGPYTTSLFFLNFCTFATISHLKQWFGHLSYHCLSQVVPLFSALSLRIIQWAIWHFNGQEITSFLNVLLQYTHLHW